MRTLDVRSDSLPPSKVVPFLLDVHAVEVKPYRVPVGCFGRHEWHWRVICEDITRNVKPNV